MNIFIVLNTEYMDDTARALWYAKSLNACLQTDSIIITHEIFKDHFRAILDEIPDRLYDEFDMDRLSDEQVKSIPHIYVPNEILYPSKFETRTAQLLFLFKERNFELEKFLKETIISLRKSKKSIEIAFHALEAFRSVRIAFETEGINLVTYVFSAIRRPHGYRDTLYMASFTSIFDSEDAKFRFSRIKGKVHKYFNLDHKEILCFFSPIKNLHLIPYFDKSERYEIGVIFEGYEIVPQIFLDQYYNTDDILYDVRKNFSHGDVLTRLHPYRIKKYKLDRNFPSDPTSSVISSKRITAVSSQLLLLGLLWNKVVVNKYRNLPFGFACEKSILSSNKASLDFLNFYVFAFLIPENLMFSASYWNWRSSNPSEEEILEMHLEYYIENSSLDYECFAKVNKSSILDKILIDRGCSSHDVSSITKCVSYHPPDDLNHFLVSLSFPDSGDTVYRRAEQCSSSVYRAQFDISPLELNSIIFFPFLDSDGFVKISNLIIYSTNGDVCMSHSSVDFNYVSSSGVEILNCANFSDVSSIVIEWHFMSVVEFHKSHHVKQAIIK